MNALTSFTRRGSSWSRSELETLTRLWTDGYSAAKVAEQLPGRTRNSVIGKVFRLKLSTRPVAVCYPTGRKPGPPKPRLGRPRKDAERVAPKRAIRAAAPPKDKAWLPLPGIVPVTLEDKRTDQCSWPLGDGPFLFCGGPTCDGSSYCESHAALSVGIGTKSERNATKRHREFPPLSLLQRTAYQPENVAFSSEDR